MIEVVAVLLLLSMGIVLVRALLGPSLFDRILAVNVFSTKTALLIAVYAWIIDRPDILDIAIVYALINFIAVIAFLKLIVRGNLSDSSPGRVQ